MPIYEYRCENGHTFEVMQRMSDDPIAACQTCGAPCHRVFHPVAVHFKGSGFYNTDYGTRKRAREKAESSEGSSGSGSSASDSSGSDSRPESAPAKDSKAATAAKTGSDGKSATPKSSD